ncbi:efflux RND transporter periplasmic adaptor subunit [Coraliomargarita sp. SDUM461004]|uniref:Efflux RND transporter periplasmic adaptor subunit n=1 Tax=Thalassobacterium sedimentorum TaxID=3041258 RepID=A0ABU1AE08_9BACT|nr:efflux RND transporter periplasmic adaptor subunit [Coraliomargarita sp. SDUM461004]MDQ8192946.1 efflux RND transporter periplasmic adaptor subunit [Coraliomargarita sp. SDUM461004]
MNLFKLTRPKFYLLATALLTTAQFSTAQTAVKVFATRAAEKAIFDEVEALGTLRANESIDLTSTVTEYVTAINFDDNQRVKKGRVLLEMDAAEEEAELAEVMSLLEESQRQVERLKPLVDRGAASESAIDEKRREVEAARARAQAIQSRINQRRIVAPFDGVVGLRNLSVGALMQPGTLITTLDDDSVMKLDFSVPSVFMSTLQPGLQIQARARAYPERLFEGTVASVDSRIDPVTRAVLARALIENSNQTLKPGMLMRVSLRKNPRESIVLPEGALVSQAEKVYVYRVLESEGAQQVERRAVELGVRRKGEAEVLGGIEVGDWIVTDGTMKLRPGAQVEVIAEDGGSETLSEKLGQAKSKL